MIFCERPPTSTTICACGLTGTFTLELAQSSYREWFQLLAKDELLAKHTLVGAGGIFERATQASCSNIFDTQISILIQYCIRHHTLGSKQNRLSEIRPGTPS
jgi:hypothetical protein